MVLTPEIYNKTHTIQGEHGLPIDPEMAHHRNERDKAGKTDGERLGQWGAIVTERQGTRIRTTTVDGE